jgi:hypothetical protein
VKTSGGALSCDQMTTEGQALILRHVPIGWSQDDYDVLAEGVLVGRIFLTPAAPAGQRGRDGGVRKELATGTIKKRRIYYEPRVFDGRVIKSDEIERGYTRRCLNSSVSRSCPIQCAS